RTQHGSFSFKSVDNTVDANTGLVSASRDTAMLETTYHYDVLGRTKDVQRPGQPIINYTYTEASAAAPAQATVAQVSSSSANGNTATDRTLQNSSVFDGFGRLIEEQRLMPAGTAKRATQYTPSGWIAQMSEWESSPS